MKRTFRWSAVLAAVGVQFVAAAPVKVECRTYTLFSVSDTLAGFGALLGADAAAPMSRYHAVFHGNVRLEVLLNANAVLVTFEPKSLEFAIDNANLGDKTQAVQVEMAYPVLLSVASGGRIVSCKFDPRVSPGTQRYERYLLALLQFDLPSVSSRLRINQTWISTEQDPTGSYRARYRVFATAPSNGYQVRKTVAKFIPSGNTPAAMAGQTTPGGGLVLVIDKGNHLVAETGTLESQTRINGKSTSKSSNQVSLRLVSSVEGQLSSTESTLIAELSKQISTGLCTAANPDAQESDIERTALADVTQEQLFAELDRIARSGDPNEDTSGLYLKLHALAYVRPESCAALGNRLAKAPADGVEFQLVARALVATGTRTAQAALAKVVKERVSDWPAESRLVPALVGLKEPTADMVACIENLSEEAKNPDVREMSTMVTGAFGRQLSMQASSLAHEVLHRLVTLLATSGTADDKRIRLLALGNTGSEEAFIAARPFLKSPDPSLRSAALTAMRWVPDSSAAALICTSLLNDADANVRASAAGSLAYIPASAPIVAALRHALRNDVNAGVRETAMAPLWQARSKFPDVVNDIRFAAERDSSKELRKAAKALLSHA